MGRLIKEENKSFFRFAVIVSLLFLIYITFISQNNLIRWAGASIEIKAQRRQIKKYKEEIEKMDEKINTLSTNKDSLEKYARENFYFAKPGDDVYLIDQ